MQTAQAGTLESNDIMISISPATPDSGINLDLDSIVLSQYGKAIRNAIVATLNSYNVTDVYVKAVDRGALDCTIKSRLITALTRSGYVTEEDAFNGY